MTNKCVVGLIAAACVLGSCKAFDTPTFQRNYSLYSAEADKAEKANDWDAARRRYFLALQNAQWAEEGTQVRARFHYKLGRAEGATCHFDTAAQNLSQAYEFDKRTPWPLIELARMNAAQNKPQEALGYFERALPELDKAGAAQKDPIALAEALEDYAQLLSKADKAEQAKTLATRANELRAGNSGKAASMLRVPYGTQCESKKS